MRILYTYFGLMQRVGGVSRYFYENIIRIRKTETVNICSLFCSNEYFRNYFKRIWFNPHNQKLIYVKIILEEFFLWLNLKFTGYDLVHITADRLSVFKWTRKPIVTTIHDMIPELYNTNIKTIQRRKRSIMNSNAIICVSENTKKDLLRIYPEVSNKLVQVIYHGYESIPHSFTREYDYPYLLYVGTRKEEYKNFTFFVTSIASLLKNRNLRLVCTGAKFSIEEIKLFQSVGIEDFVLSCGYVSELRLANLYHFAECFVYPSKYEGFGIPILEAFSYQTPACISETSCFPEVGGDAVAYFDPCDPDSINRSIIKIVSDKEYRQNLIRKGMERLKLFTWDKAAHEHIDFYRKVIKNSEK